MVVVMSCAVTMVVIVLSPTLNGIAAEAVPDVTATLLTVTVALASRVVGVIVMDEVTLPTVNARLFDNGEKPDTLTPWLGTSDDNKALLEGALVTVKV